jgi:hypothetical protein
MASLSGRSIRRRGVLAMQPSAVWIIYTLMFGYPVPTLEARQFTSESACIIHMRSFSQQIIDSFKLVCARQSIVPASS